MQTGYDEEILKKNFNSVKFKYIKSILIDNYLKNTNNKNDSLKINQSNIYQINF